MKIKLIPKIMADYETICRRVSVNLVIKANLVEFYDAFPFNKCIAVACKTAARTTKDVNKV